MRNRTRANPKERLPSRSRVAGVRDLVGEDCPATLDLEDDSPVSFVENPLEVVPHDKVPEKLRKAIVDTYGEEFFLSREWTRVQLKRLQRAITYARENLSTAIVQICSPRCTMRDVCAYDIAGKPPLGDRCPIELKHAEIAFDQYVEAIGERLNLSPQEIRNDIVLSNFIMGLVEADIVELRLNHKIANDGLITEEIALINEETGQAYYKDEVSVAVRIKESIERKKSQIFKALLATPEMAARYRNRNREDALSKHAELIERLEALVREQESKRALLNTDATKDK